ncbi:CHASE domain-containing protein [Massilia sp. PWRC2]|uniref:CHASE domain-containing protein n=1 Tax=Massilia sp. PWRC2 TaxID=2804626 RepID=UPI003CF6C5C9
MFSSRPPPLPTPTPSSSRFSARRPRAAPGARWRLRQAEALALIVFALALAATFSLWQVAERQIERNRQSEFDVQARRTLRSLEQRMATYEQVERDTVGFLLGKMEVQRADFRLYVDAIGLQQRFPGIQGLALVRLVPAAARAAHVAAMRADGAADYDIKPGGARPVYSSITHIEPFTGLNLRALGFDMLTEPIRRAAMERARDSGEAAASGKVRLIQENGRDVQSGFVMYLPVYQRGAATATLAQRRASLLGWVGAPFRMDDLMAGLGGERSPEVTLAIYDGAGMGTDTLLYTTDGANPQPARFTAHYRSVREIRVGGARWTVDIGSTAQLEARLATNGAAWIAIGGAVASTLLAMLVLALGSGRRRALNLATAMTEQLSESEFRWKYALEGAGDGVWDWDRAADAATYSKQWKSMLGYADHELVDSPHTWQTLLHPDDAVRVRATLDAYVEQRSAAYACEYRMRGRDGSYRWILGRGMAVTFERDGRPLRLIGTHTDITRAKEAENAMRLVNQQLAQQQHRFNVILQHSHDAFIAIGADGIITDWNASAERMFGWSGAEAVGRPLAELIIPAEQRAHHHAGFARFIASGHGRLRTNVREVTALHRSGRLVPAELALAAFPEGSQFAVSAFIRDVSDRKAAERTAAERSVALEEARQALSHAQKLEAVGKLTGGIAHDFNNVLQIINGNVQLLQQFVPSAVQLRQRLTSIGAAVARGAKLSSQLLAFARRQPLQPSALEPLRVLRDRDDLLQRALGEQIVIEYRHDADLWNVFVDAGQLENVFLNLALNARDAMPGGGTFLVDIRNTVLGLNEAHHMADIAPGEYLRLRLSDSGCGMSADVMAHAFEPFFTTKPVGHGTGLGLSMAYGFVKQSGGHIRLESQAGHGTTIEIFLPRSRLAPAPALLTAPVTVHGGDETILVVEDDEAVRASVVGTLEGLGYRVLDAANGAAGLAVLQAAARSGSAIDLLFSDVVMPGPVSSTELAEKAQQLLPQLAVLFTSGYTRNALIVGGRLGEGVQLLSKPYQREQLAQRIRDMLHK